MSSQAVVCATSSVRFIKQSTMTWPAPSLTARLSGVPVMQLEIRNAVERDRLVYNAFGFAAGALIAIVFFRRLSFMMIGAGPPLIAIVLALGALTGDDQGSLEFLPDQFGHAQRPRIRLLSALHLLRRWVDDVQIREAVVAEPLGDIAKGRF